MDLLAALQASWLQGCGCRAVGDSSGVVRWLTRTGQTHLIHGWSPATRRPKPFFFEGGPAVMSEWLRRYELCPLPFGVEPDVAPAKPYARPTLSDLL